MGHTTAAFLSTIDQAEYWESILKILVTVTPAILVAWVGYQINRWYQHRQTLKAVLAELADIHRHLRANMRNLKGVELSQGIPRRLHFEKMKIPDFYVLSKKNLGEGMNPIRYKVLLQTLVIFRNLNLEFDEVIKAIYSKKSAPNNFQTVFTQQDLEQLIGFIAQRMVLAEARVSQNIEELRKRSPRYNEALQPVQIFYHRIAPRPRQRKK